MTLEPRLAAHMLVSAFIRRANAGGDFAAILHKGDRTSGTIMLVGLVRGVNPKIFEKFPSLDGSSAWQSIDSGEPFSAQEVTALIEKRTSRDPDLWVIELDAADDERLNGLLTAGD
jgi:hypothetical protein